MKDKMAGTLRSENVCFLLHSVLNLGLQRDSIFAIEPGEVYRPGQLLDCTILSEVAFAYMRATSYISQSNMVTGLQIIASLIYFKKCWLDNNCKIRTWVSPNTNPDTDFLYLLADISQVKIRTWLKHPTSHTKNNCLNSLSHNCNTMPKILLHVQVVAVLIYSVNTRS